MADTSKGYGTASYSGASSDTPGQRTRAPLTVNHDDSDAVLANIRANGAKHRDDPSVFTGRGGKRTPGTTPGMRDANAGGAPMGKVFGAPGRQPVKRG
jgi:hypothetical protein